MNAPYTPGFRDDPLYTPKWAMPADPADRKDWIGLILVFLSAFLTVDFGFAAGMNLGFTIAYACLFLGALVYLAVGYGVKSLFRNPFSTVCGLLSLSLCPIFAVCADGLEKTLAFLAICLLFALFLGGATSILYRGVGGFRLLYDAARILISLPFTELFSPLRGARAAREKGERKGKFPAILVGFAACVPALCIVIPLLISADDAFAGMMERVFGSVGETLLHLIFALLLTPFLLGPLYAMRHRQVAAPAPGANCRRLDSGVVYGFLGTLSAVYLIYLLSQTAYFFSAFASVLPQGYTAADYARKGFFELCALTLINLFFLFLACTLVKRKEGDPDVPRSVKGFGIFLCLFDLALTGTAISKMALYVARFGLTRLRLLTGAFMILMAVFLICLTLRLIWRRMPYMALSLVLCTLLGGALLYADVDTVVANYNVDAYLTGRLETVDVYTLTHLGPEAVPALDRLCRESSDPHCRHKAMDALNDMRYELPEESDFRSYNRTTAKARAILGGYRRAEDGTVASGQAGSAVGRRDGEP